MIRRTPSRRASSCVIQPGIADGAGALPADGPEPPGMARRWPPKMWLGLAIALARTIDATVTP